MQCPKCQHNNPENAKFCLECGNKLELSCPQCSKILPLNAKFCSECGYKLSDPEPIPKELSVDDKIEKIQKYLPKGLTDKILSQRDKIEGEKKQVTVMFCDMEGSTRLIEKLGPEEAYNIMDKIYEILIHKIHEYEGTVNELTGDGIMALFGAPIALENAPQRAIQSALAIHREITKFNDQKRTEGLLSPVKMRIGIHTGPVVVGTLGNDLRVEFKAVGETVILASRMESLAQAGTTYITDDTFKLTEGFFRCEALGEKQVKGKDSPVAVYQVLATSTRSTRFEVNAERGLTPFVGRDRSLELLLDGFERAKAGRGQAFSIVAEAGLGKTRLLYEFRKAVASEDVTFIEGRCLSYSQSEAYYPVIDVLKAAFNITENDNEFEIREKISNGLKTIQVDAAEILPYILEFLSVKDSGIDANLSPEEKKSRFIKTLKQIFLKRAEVQPTILAVEDLHWMDKTSEEIFKELFESIAGSSVLLMFTYRPEFIHTWGAKTYHSQINLNRLSNRESLMMVSHILGTSQIDLNLEELILEKSEGIPFFIEELLKSLTDLKIIEQRNGRYDLAKDTKDLSIPSTIKDVIMARVDPLPEDAKVVLQTGSAIEREFSYELIEKVTGLTEHDLVSHLSVLKDSELVYERGIFPHSSYIFKHALTREVVYDSILASRAKKLHEEIGRSIENLYPARLVEFYEMLAYHYSVSDNPEKAYDFLRLSGLKAWSKYSNIEAYDFYRKAFETLCRLPDTEENKKKIIEICRLIHNPATLLNLPDGSLEIFQKGEQLSKELGDKVNLSLFYSVISLYYIYEGNALESIDYAEPRFYEAKKNNDVESIVFFLISLCMSNMRIGNLKRLVKIIPEVVHLLEKSEKISIKFGAPMNEYSYLLSTYGICLLHLGNLEDGRISIEKALSFATQINDVLNLSICELHYGYYYILKGDGKTAIEYFQNSIKYSEKGNWTGLSGYTWLFLGYAYYLLGNYEKAKKNVEKCIEFAQDDPSGLYTEYRLYLCEIYHAIDELTIAEKNAEEALKLSIRFHERSMEAESRIWIGRISAKMDDSKHNEAEKFIVEGIKILEELELRPLLSQAYFFLGELYANTGRKDEALTNLNKALSMCKEMGMGFWPDKIQEVLDRL